MAKKKSTKKKPSPVRKIVSKKPAAASNPARKKPGKPAASAKANKITKGSKPSKSGKSASGASSNRVATKVSRTGTKKPAGKSPVKSRAGIFDLLKKKPAPSPAPLAVPAAAPSHADGLPPVPPGMQRIDVRDNHFFNSTTHHMDTRRVPIYKLADRAGYFFRASMNVDADGAPKCYHPTNDGIALDDLENATSNSKRFIQGQNGVGPADDFFVSQTSLLFRNDQSNRCDNFVDAVEIPYLVFPNQWHDVGLGDCGMIFNTQNGRITHAIFADTNPRVGEASVKSARNLGRTNATPRNGIDEDIFIYLIFPGSKFNASADAPHWADNRILQAANAAFQTWGGIARMQQIAAQI